MPEEMGAAVVAEPVEATESSTAVETGAEAVETGTNAEEVSSESGSQAEKSDLTEKTPVKTKLNLREVSKAQKDKLAAINPALPAAIEKAAFELQGLYREFPGGLREAVALRNTVQEFGGVEGAKELQSAVAEYGTLEKQFENGDPAFITSLADAAPDSFSQIMPAGLEKWKQVDKDGFEHTIARSIVDTLAPSRVLETLAWVHNALDAEKGKEFRAELARLYQVFEGIEAKSKQAPERKVDPKENALSEREQQLAQREIQVNMRPITTEARSQVKSILDREMMANYQWDKTDADVKQAVEERIIQELKNLNDKTFTDEFERLKDRGDWAGLSRHVRNFQERVTPNLIPRVARLFAVKPKGAPVTPGKKPVVNGSGKQAETGWVRIAAQPKASQIDYAKMGSKAEDLILEGKAILKDGRRVEWAL